MTTLLPLTEPACAAEAGSWCARFWRWTDSDLLASSADAIVGRTVETVVIVVVAVVSRYLVHRMIGRLVDGVTSRRLRLAPPRLGSGSISEGARPAEGSPRRAQRARTIGSVLRSAASAIILGIAAVMILAEFGVALGPILASAGIVGVAIGFGAQTLVRDFLSGMFMLLEDQYGVGDSVDLGDAVGVVETVGLRVTTVRDMRGVLWYIRNGEIIRVGNKSQGWAMVVIDIPIGFVNSEEATAVLRTAAQALADEPEHATEFLEPPDVIGVEQLTVDGAVIRTIAKTTADGQPIVQRELRRRLTEALETSGISQRIAVSRMMPRSAVPPAFSGGSGNSSDTPGGAT